MNGEETRTETACEPQRKPQVTAEKTLETVERKRGRGARELRNHRTRRRHLREQPLCGRWRPQHGTERYNRREMNIQPSS